MPWKTNNTFLDSIILFPDKIDNNSFIMISLQITIRKNNIYSLQEYHSTTSSAETKIQDVYGVCIKQKYFSFILAKEYWNKTTQENLIL